MALYVFVSHAAERAEFSVPNPESSIVQVAALPTAAIAATGSNAKTGERWQRVSTLQRLAEAQQALGDYASAEHILTQALAAAEELDDEALVASVLGSLGDVYIALGPPATAEQHLTRGASLAEKTGATRIRASILTNLGNHYTLQKAHAKAFAAYSESWALARESGDASLAAHALASGARAALRAGDFKQARSIANQARNQTEALKASRDKAYLLINIARTLSRLGERQPNARQRLLLESHAILSRAQSVATDLDDTRAISYALGYLGNLYESENRYEEALSLTDRAIFHAQEIDESALLYRWYWQTGRIRNAIGEQAAAIDAYQTAVDMLKDLRYRMQVQYGTDDASFQESIGSAYFEFVDLLLKQAAQTTDPQQQQAVLKKARATVEQLKAAELRDYFKDDCVDELKAKAKDVEHASLSAVIVYPILLDDRMELLLSFPGGVIRRYPVVVNPATITGEVRALRRLLEKSTTNEYRPHARQLYAWLIAPFEADLAPYNIDTLVFVPDGALRTIPMAALYDGQRFLIEKYALARTPSLELTDPRPLDRENRNALLGGLSKAVAGFPALDHVPQELESIQKTYGGRLLLDEAFRRKELKETLSSKKLNVVHIATHGEFRGDINNSFLLAYDGQITFDELASYVGLFKFRDTPLELLVLSACQTAQGDDRAALGLSGIAIKAGARSALGSLWKVNDVATALLMGDFYEQLRNPAVSRAVALQRAQSGLLKDLRYRHPGYWSAFLLISNWL